MSECCREATPVEVLERDLKDILSRPLKEEERDKQIKEAIAKAMCYERDYYEHHYVVVRNQLEDAKRESKILSTQSRVLAEYIIMKEEYGGKECL